MSDQIQARSDVNGSADDSAEISPAESIENAPAVGQPDRELPCPESESEDPDDSVQTGTPTHAKAPEDKPGDRDPGTDMDSSVAKQDWAGRIVSACIVLLAFFLITIVVINTDKFPRTDDAEVFANYIGMAPVVDGPLTEVNVRDNQQMRTGEVLFRIDDRPYKYALQRALSDQAQLEGQIVDESRQIQSQQSAAEAAQASTETAEANVGRAEGAVNQAAANIHNAQASLQRAEATYAYSLDNLHRVEPLLTKQFVTVDQVDQLRTGTANNELAVHQAEAQVRIAEAELQSNRAIMRASQTSVSQSSAQHRQSQHAINTLEPLTAQRGARQSAIQTAQYNLDHCVVRSPFEARVTNLTLAQGAYARAGTQLFTMIDTRVWWVVANFRETQLRHVRPGMHASVYLLAYPDRRYRGVVESASFGVTPDPSTIGTFASGLPDAQRTLSWVHLASRYPVRIRILDPEPESFRISESATVEVLGWQRW